MMETLNEEGQAMTDTFQIYLQTMISQALDSNFLREIAKEQGEGPLLNKKHSKVPLFLRPVLFYSIYR